MQLIAASYPTRIPYADIHGRYKEHMPDFVQAIYAYVTPTITLALTLTLTCQASCRRSSRPNPNPNPNP